MDELYAYLKEKLMEFNKSRKNTIEIDCLEFMQILKMVCYMKQVRRIVDDDI